MYTRKDFLLTLMTRAGRLAHEFVTLPTLQTDRSPAVGAGADALFNEAMALGIDPGSIPVAELEAIVARRRNAKRETVPELRGKGGGGRQTGR